MVERPILSLWIVVLILLSAGVGEATALSATGQVGNQTATPSNVQNETVTAIDSCTNITSPGEYELVDDIQTDEAGTCLRITAEDVVLDGNGHTIDGPGSDEQSTGIYPGDDDVVIRNLEITGWNAGITANGHYQLENATVRENGIGLNHFYWDGTATLANVVIEQNDGLGIEAAGGSGNGTNVTIRENGEGLFLWEGSYDFESSRIVDNEGTGIRVSVHSSITVTNTTVSSNGGHGISLDASASWIVASIEDSTISDNHGDGIYL